MLFKGYIYKVNNRKRTFRKAVRPVKELFMKIQKHVKFVRRTSFNPKPRGMSPQFFSSENGGRGQENAASVLKIGPLV